MRGIDPGHPETAGADDLDVHRRPDAAPQELAHPRDQIVHLHRAWIQRLASRKGQEALGQGGGPARAGLGGADIAVDAVEAAFAQPLFEKLQAAADAGEEIVEVVRDAPGELAHGLHLLRLPERFLNVLKLGRRGGFRGDVTADRIEDAAFDRRVRHGRPGERDGLAIGFQEPHPELVHGLAALQGRHDLPGHAEVVGMDDLRKGP